MEKVLPPGAKLFSIKPASNEGVLEIAKDLSKIVTPQEAEKVKSATKRRLEQK